MCCMQLGENTGHKESPENSPSAHYRTTLLGCIFATKACIDNWKKNMLNSIISSTRSHNMVNFGPLAAENGLPVWGTPANFNGFRVLSSLLHRHHSTDANQTLHDVWPSPGLVHYIYIFGGSCTEPNINVWIPNLKPKHETQVTLGQTWKPGFCPRTPGFAIPSWYGVADMVWVISICSRHGYLHCGWYGCGRYRRPPWGGPSW